MQMNLCSRASPVCWIRSKAFSRFFFLCEQVPESKSRPWIARKDEDLAEDDNFPGISSSIGQILHVSPIGDSAHE